MCVAIVIEKNAKKFPSAEILYRCEQANNAGAGVAWIEKGNVRWWKGIDTNTILEHVLPNVEPPIIIHYRIPTNGGAVPELCHPFSLDRRASTELSGNAKAVMFHNGHFHNWNNHLIHLMPRAFGDKNQHLPGGPWSDTRGIAFLGGIYGLPFLSLMADPGNKIAVLDHKGRTFRFGGPWEEPEKESGIFYSNMLWYKKEFAATPTVTEKKTPSIITSPANGNNQSNKQTTPPTILTLAYKPNSNQQEMLVSGSRNL